MLRSLAIVVLVFGILSGLVARDLALFCDHEYAGCLTWTETGEIVLDGEPSLEECKTRRAEGRFPDRVWIPFMVER